MAAARITRIRAGILVIFQWPRPVLVVVVVVVGREEKQVNVSRSSVAQRWSDGGAVGRSCRGVVEEQAGGNAWSTERD